MEQFGCPPVFPAEEAKKDISTVRSILYIFCQEVDFQDVHILTDHSLI